MSTTRTILVERASVLLQRLSSRDGIYASIAETANYRSVFTRDAVMAGCAGCLLDLPDVKQAFAVTLWKLRDLQGAEGQIPSNYAVADGRVSVSFGTLVPRLDGISWYILGVALAARAKIVSATDFRESVTRAVRLLDALEYNGQHLIYVPVGGNWADEYVYDGYILFDQALRAWALRCAGEVYAEPGWSSKAANIARAVAREFWQPEDAPLPAASFSPTTRRDIFDLAAVSLIGFVPELEKEANRALSWITERYLSSGRLPPVFSPVIDEGHADWPALARYHRHGFRNRPYEYHNGGIWPVWLGWLSLALSRHGHNDALRLLHDLSAEALPDDWAFSEYLHGETLVPGGVVGMGYGATGVALLHCAGSRAASALLE